MSFSFSVPTGPVSSFNDRAVAAKAALEATNEANDYMLTQLASDTADAAIKAATDLVDMLDPNGIANSASIAGHHSDDGVSASSVSVSVSVSPTPATVVAPTEAVLAPPEEPTV